MNSTAPGDGDSSADVATLELVPAMPHALPPEWAGARWVGNLDLNTLANCQRVRLQSSEGYRRARLLVRDNATVMGFIELDAPNGMIARSALDRAVNALAPVVTTIVPGLMPSITVIVCTRDRPSQLREALGAILRLGYPDFNVVVVDNASRTTQTRDLIRNEFRLPSVSLVVESVAGLSHARNAGLVAATGELVAFTDDDVIVDSAWLRELAAGFTRTAGVDCVTGLVASGELRTPAQDYFDDRVTWSRNLEPRTYSLANPPTDLPMFPFSIGVFGTGANFALRRRTALELGGFDTALGVGTRTGGGEDIDMFTRVLLDGRSLVVQPSAVVWHRNRDDLASLRIQARGYGMGLGAWMMKLLMNPRTARMALVRSPLAMRRLVSMTRRKPRSPAAAGAVRDEWDREIGRVRWLELVSIARGPLRYLLQRRSGKAAAR